MGRPYEFADESLYTEETLWSVVHGAHNLAIQTDDTETLTDLEHMTRHAHWEYKQRREDHYRATAGRVVIEKEKADGIQKG